MNELFDDDGRRWGSKNGTGPDDLLDVISWCLSRSMITNRFMLKEQFYWIESRDWND